MLAAAAILLVTWASRHVVAFKERVKLGFAILGNWRVYVEQVVSWQALSWVFRTASVFFFLRAFGVPATVDTVLAVLVVGGLATTLPFTPGGAGTQQAVLVFALADWASRSAVLSFSVGMQLTTVVVNVVDRVRGDRRHARDRALARARPGRPRAHADSRGTSAGGSELPVRQPLHRRRQLLERERLRRNPSATSDHASRRSTLPVKSATGNSG